MRQGALGLVFIAAAGIAAAAPYSRKEAGAGSTDVRATFQDIQAALGTVPGFFKAFPDGALPGAWAAMKAVQMNPVSSIPARYKELIGLAVSAQIPCHYCTYFHTRTAKLQGATDAEIEQALGEASLTRFLSTWLNGTGVDPDRFRADIDRISARMQRRTTAGAPPRTAFRDAAEARADLEETLGFVPGFLADMPPELLGGVWSELKALEMASGPIPAKYVSLTSLGVAAQVPCDYCVYADSAFARAAGATDEELKEAVAVAATVRHWSTYLNGVRYDDRAFQKEVDQIVRNLEKKK